VRGDLRRSPGPCLKNEGNLNNEFGLPITLLRRGAEHKSVVVELGMNHRGEIARLAAIAQPRVGVITNAGTAHIEHLGSRENIALEKGDLVAALDADATAVLNADDPLVLAQADAHAARVVRFGRGELADVRADGVARRRRPPPLRALGAAGRDRGFGRGPRRDDRCPTRSRPRPPRSRRAYRSRTSPQGCALLARRGPAHADRARARRPLIDDTYNANPQSMEVALRTLARGDGGRRIAVLGDMGELGEYGADAHRDAGALAAQLGIDRLYAVGAQSGEVVAAARAAAWTRRRCTRAATGRRPRSACSTGSRGRPRAREGSRSMRMERIVEHVRRGAGDA
jgi:UDP-N-acetylmuramoyl-tripeptide--D-alanyl-D-alanine ligase